MICPILRYPDPRLTQLAARVVHSHDVVRLVSDLTDTLYASGGVGLAAP